MSFVLKLNPAAHHDLKVYAAINNITMSEAVQQLITERTETAQKGEKRGKLDE